MARNIVKLIFLTLLVAQVAGNEAAAQEPPFYKEIQAYKRKDSLQAPPKDAILFIGSSSFNFWKDVHNYFPKHTIINRGFGGSTLKDVIFYADDIIYPYSPRQVVIYCGENDLATDRVSPDSVLARFKKLFGMIRGRFKGVPVLYVSIKPSPSRQHLMPKMVEANKMIKKFLRSQRGTVFVDVYSKMLLPDGSPRPDIFTKDNLHMNAKGYEIWTKEMEPHLIK